MMRPRGITLLEMVLAMSLTLVVFGVTHFLLSRTVGTWWKVNASEDVQRQLYKAQDFLERDLKTAAFELQAGRETIAVRQSPPQLVSLAGADGDVIWFLSAVDPFSGDFQRHPDGSPFWQRNIVYFAVTPTALPNYSGPGTDVGGYEMACPYKMFIRMEIDSGVPTSPLTDPATSAEALLTGPELAPYLKRPVGNDASSLIGPGVAVRPLCANALTFRCILNAPTRGVGIDLRCTGVDQASRGAPIDTRDLTSDPATRQLRFTVFPPNRQTSSP